MLRDNSKAIYVMLKTERAGDFAWRLPCTANTDLSSVLDTAFPGADFSSAKIVIRRSTVAGDKAAISVRWQGTDNERRPEDNIKLLPGDRVMVTGVTGVAGVAGVAGAAGAAVVEQPVASTKGTTQQQATDAVVAQPPVVAPIAVSSLPDGALIAGTDQYTLVGSDGKVTLELPRIIWPQLVNVKQARVRMHVEVLTDKHDNMTEFKVFQSGNVLLADSDQFSASLRIMKKNQLIEAKQAPAITCDTGKCSRVEVDGIRIEVTPHIQADARIMLAMKLDRAGAPTYDGETGSRVLISNNQSVVLRAASEEGTYLVLTPELLR